MRNLPWSSHASTLLSSQRRASRFWLQGVLFVVLAALLGVMVVTPSFGAAPTVTVSPSTARPGDTLTVTGRDLPKGDHVQLSWDGSTSGMPSARTKGNGSFSLKLVVPPSLPGSHTVGVTAASVRLAATVVVSEVALNVIGSPTASAIRPDSTATSTPQPSATLVSTRTTTPAPTSSPTKSPTPVPTRTATATEAPTQVVPSSATPVVSTGLAAEERQLVNLINGSRAEVSASPVSIHETLMSVARWRAEDMETRHYSSHVIPAGACYAGRCWNTDIYVWDVLSAIGMRWANVGENLWQGGGPEADLAETANVVFLGSPSHRDNMLNPAWTHAGTGMARYHWTNGSHVVELFIR